MNKRFVYLDVLRVICVGLVMYGHFVMVGGGALVIPKIINPNTVLPLIDETRWQAYSFEVWLIKLFSTQSAILGVSLFFLITGYLIPSMCERYRRTAFLINRFFRIFPALAGSLVLLGTFLYFSQGITFELKEYLSSLSLTFFYTRIENISGVLWTLAIELLFYLIAFLIGRFTLQRLFFAQAILLLTILVGTLFPNHYHFWIIGWQARYILMITIGSAIYLAQKELKFSNQIQIILPSLLMSFIGFQLFKFGQVDITTYETIGTHLLATGIFIVFIKLGPKLVSCVPQSIMRLADMVYYPLYLIHAATGLAAIAALRNLISNPYLLLTLAVIISVFFAWCVHILIEQPGIHMGRLIIRKYKLT